MKTIQEYVESGILELYVLEICSAAEKTEVEEMALAHEEIRKEISEIRKALELYAKAYASAPDPTLKPFILASVDYVERIKKGEQPSFPPELNELSKTENYLEWVNREDMVLPEDFTDFYAKIIGHTPQMISAIIWIERMAPEEVHDNEYEKFLILEGTCTITIGATVHSLVPGNYMAIPLHSGHNVKVTSLIPCKAILQRIVA